MTGRLPDTDDLNERRPGRRPTIALANRHSAGQSDGESGVSLHDGRL